jgi:hypothetical protein
MISIPDQMINARLVKSMLSFNALALRGEAPATATARHERVPGTAGRTGRLVMLTQGVRRVPAGPRRPKREESIQRLHKDSAAKGGHTASCTRPKLSRVQRAKTS